MKKIRIILLPMVAYLLFCSHDMFLKFDSYFLEPNTEAVLQLFNGTFEKSDNSIDRTRMLDVSLVGNKNRSKVDSSQWLVKDSITYLKFKTGVSGTWVAGVSTKARDFEMEAKKFNDYLKNDGVFDILESRKANKKLNENAFEKYSKHVKSIFQVGDELSDDWKVNLGYPIEFIPLENPYEIHSGHSLPVKLLRDGKPLANHFVYVGHKPNQESHSHDHKHDAKNHTYEYNHDGEQTHSHENLVQDNEYKHGEETHTHNASEKKSSHKHDNVSVNYSHEHKDDKNEHSHSHESDSEVKAHVHDEVSQLKTDANGVINIDINAEGTWFLRTIHMVELDDKKLTHESNWATLTFGISSGLGHSHDEIHEHADEHQHDEEGFPSYIFWIASIILVCILFFFFNRKKSNG